MTFTRRALPHEAEPAAALPAFAARGVGGVLAVLAVVLTALSGRYGFHRDELYFVAAGRRLAWGYVDQPPLTPLLARISTTLFGDTVMGLRVVAMLDVVAVVALAALIARELSGGPRAQVLTAICTSLSSLVLACGHMVSTESFDLFFWLAVSLFVLRALRTDDHRWFLAAGAAFGVGLLNKDLLLLLAGGLLAGLVVAGPRHVLRSRWLAGAAVLALLVAAPNIWWQATHGWPLFTVAGGIGDKSGFENRVSFVPFQLIHLAPPLAAIWLAGFVRMWREPSLRWSRPFVVAYPVLAVLMLICGGKPYYVIPLLIVAMAAGAEPALRWARTVLRRRVLIGALAFCLVADALATLPLLPPTALSVVNAMNKEQGAQVGWPALAHTVAGVWQQIPASERGRSVVFTQNYGEAAAIERYGPADGLPKVYSGHMSYADWGRPPDSADGEVVVVQYPDNVLIAPHFTGCRVAATVDDGVGLANDEQGSQVLLCAGSKASWSSMWPSLRLYY